MLGGSNLPSRKIYSMIELKELILSFLIWYVDMSKSIYSAVKQLEAPV